MQAPRVPYFDALCHTIRYDANFIGQGILLQAADKLTFQAFSDTY